MSNDKNTSAAIMKILIIERTIESGGAVINLLNTAAALRKFGHQIKIATVFVDKLPDLPPQATDFDYQTPPLWAVNLSRKNRFALAFLGPIFLFGVVLKSAAWANVLNPNTFPAHWIASIVGFIKRKPVVWSCHEPYISIASKDVHKVGWLTYFISLVARGPWDKLFVKQIDQISAVSQRCKDWVDKRYGKNSFVNYPGIDFNYYSGGARRAAVKEYRLQGKFVLLNIGVFTPMKNQEVLIAMMALLREKIPEAVLLLVGEGPMRGYLERRVAELELSKRVRFLGTLYDEPKSKIDLCAAADIFLFSAYGGQTWGMVPFEALCSGTPVVVSDDCGAAEVVGKEKIGLVVAPTADAFAEAVLELYKKPELGKEFGCRGKEFVKENLTWERYAGKLEVSFKAVVKSRTDLRFDIYGRSRMSKSK